MGFGKGGSFVSGAFDPYHRWLGIPAKDQPANHYRLLGIELFESDPEVIRDAAERQIAHVRTYQLGNYVELSQRILNELGAAKACLLDPSKRSAYDASLKGRSRPPRRTATPEERREVPPIGQPATRPEIPRPTKRVAASEDDRKPSPLYEWIDARQNRLIQIGSATAAILLLIGVLALARRLWDSSGTLNAKPVSHPSSQPTAPSAPKQVAVDRGPQKSVPAPTARPPKLARIRNQTIDEGMTLEFQIRCDDVGTCRGRLRFRLAAGAPPEATIHPFTGMFSWKPANVPGRAQGIMSSPAGTSSQVPTGNSMPGVYPVTVQIQSDGPEKLSDQTTFQVTVRKVAKPPVIDSVGDQRVAAGRKIRFTIGARNPNGTLADVVFSLLDAPPWVSLDPVTRTVTCEPAETESAGSYAVTIRAADKTMEQLQDEKTFTVVVMSETPRAVPAPATPVALRANAAVAPPGNMAGLVPGNTNVLPPGVANFFPPGNMAGISARIRMGRSPEKPGFGSSVAPIRSFKIELPSGTVLTSLDVDVRNAVSREIDNLWEKCWANSPNVVYAFQTGSTSVLDVLATVKGNKLDGPAVLLHSGGPSESQKPKHFITYQGGRRQGMLATWNADGQPEFWGNYAAGQRQGLCCLFKADALVAVAACTRGRIDAVHLIAESQVAKSWKDPDEALADDAAGPLVKRIEDIEKDLRKDDQELRERLKQEIQRRIGAVNSGKRSAFDARASGRQKSRDQTIQGIRKAAGY
jgi:hypothetical protein